MAYGLLNRAMSQYPTVTTLNAADYFPFLDVSNVSISTTGKLSKISVADMASYFEQAIDWQVVTSGPIVLAASHGYFSNGLSLITFELPAIASVGDIYLIRGVGPGLFRITQNIGQQTIFGTAVTSIGPTGYILSLNVGDCINIQCWAANTSFIVSSGPQSSYLVV